MVLRVKVVEDVLVLQKAMEIGLLRETLQVWRLGYVLVGVGLVLVSDWAGQVRELVDAVLVESKVTKVAGGVHALKGGEKHITHSGSAPHLQLSRCCPATTAARAALRPVYCSKRHAAALLNMQDDVLRHAARASSPATVRVPAACGTTTRATDVSCRCLWAPTRAIISGRNGVGVAVIIVVGALIACSLSFVVVAVVNDHVGKNDPDVTSTSTGRGRDRGSVRISRVDCDGLRHGNCGGGSESGDEQVFACQSDEIDAPLYDMRRRV